MSLSTRLDKLVGLFSPGAQLERARSRGRLLDMERMYAAARPTEDAAGWLPLDRNVNDVVRASSPVVRARVRQLVRDFPYFDRAVRMRAALVVGNGIRLQARYYGAGKASATLDAALNEAVESAFERWCEQADFSGRLHFYDMQALAERQLLECGEYFFIRRFDRGRYALQGIEGDRLTGHGARAADGKIIPQREQDEEYRLRFITGGMLSTAELSILQARKEINLFAERTHRMFGMVRDLLHTTNDNDFNKLFSRIEKYENISDNMEVEIANYLNQVSDGRLSSESKLQIRAMLREVTEIESIGDSCYNLARTINRKHRSDMDFTPKQYDHIHQMFQLTDDALSQMISLVEDEHHVVDVNKSFNIENEINNYRNQLKNQNVLDVNNKEYDYQMGVHYMDIIGECEKLGDYVVNVVEASSNVKEKKS